MKKIAYIVSLKYAPGLWKEIRVLAENLAKHGFNVKCLVSKGYKWMAGEESFDVRFISSSGNIKEMIVDTLAFPFRIGIKFRRIFKQIPPDFICMYNPHPLNFAVLLQARMFSANSVMRAIYLHEPGKPDKSVYSYKGRLFLKVVEFTQKIAVANTTDIILPSPFAMELFERYFSNYSGRKHYAPLLLSNYPSKSNKERQYFSMVGRFNFSKRLDLFIEIINHAAEKNETLKFQIVTSSNIGKCLNKLTSGGKLITQVIRKEQLGDDEIGCSIVESIGILSLQPMVTQSGVVPFAFMNSTPVIVRSDPGFTQYVKHKYNGWVLPDDFSCEDVIEAMKFIRNNSAFLSANAFQSYVDCFSEQNWDKYYAWLL